MKAKTSIFGSGYGESLRSFVMEKEIKISREFSFILDENGKTEEIRHYRNEKLVARYGSVYDENGNVIGVRQLRVEDVAPLSLLEKVKKAWRKKPEKLDYLNWIGVINFIGTINRINKVKTIEKIELIDLITKVSEITTIKKIEEITALRDITWNPRSILQNPFFEQEFTGWEQTGTVSRVYTSIPRFYMAKFEDDTLGMLSQRFPVPLSTNAISDFSFQLFGYEGSLNVDVVTIWIFYSDGSNSEETFQATEVGSQRKVITPDADKHIYMFCIYHKTTHKECAVHCFLTVF